MSFASIALTAVSVRDLVLNRFSQMVADPSIDRFALESLAYYRHFGSWETAIQSEDFGRFIRRMVDNGVLPPPQSNPDHPPLSNDLFGFNNLAPMAPSQPSGGPPEGPLGMGPPGPPPPSPYQLLDLEGKIVIAPRHEDLGEFIEPSRLKYAIPVYDNDEIIGYIHSEIQEALIGQQLQFLTAINDSLWVALALVAVLAIPVGVILGRKLADPINTLDRAMRSMHPGAIKQSVPVTTKDELGSLTANFNKMTRDLSRAYDELEKSQQKMKEMSQKDPLTKLPNRRAFDDSVALVLTQAQRHNRPCTLAMVDVDHFKRINDNYTHAVGDQVLVLLAKKMQSNLRDADVLARYGGEEFMILFPETDLQTAYTSMERLRKHIASEDWSVIAEGLAVTVSSGLAEMDIYDSSSDGLEKVLHAADEKLYLAKDNGRNRTEM